MPHGAFGTAGLVRSKVLRRVLYLGVAATLVYPWSQGFPTLDCVNISGPCRVGEGAATRSRNIYNNRAGAPESVVVCGAKDSMPDKRPMFWWEKFTRADRVPGEHFDNGVAYMQLRKDGGSANAVNLTASVIQTGGTGDSIAVHGRATGYSPESKAFAGWFYAHAPQPFQQMTGIEINLRNDGAESPWVAHGFPKATSVGLNVSMADRSAFPGTHAIYIAAQTGARGWRTGIFIPENAIEPTDPAGNGEAMRFNGGRTKRDAYKLLRTGGQFVSGLETTGATFSRGILEMAEGQYLAWGGSPDKAGESKLGVESNMLNFSGAGLQLRPISAAPRNPEEGAIVFADGTNWNPGQGRGFYGFERGAWRKL